MATVYCICMKSGTLVGGTVRRNMSSRDLLEVESGGGFPETLLITKKMEQTTCKKTFKLPQSSVLEKAKLFLPQIAEANSKLPEMSGQTDGEELNIENTSNCKGPVIEMNLGLFEYSTSSSEMDSSSSEDSGSEYCREVTERNFKIQKLLKRPKPHIEEITTPKTNPVNSKIPS